MTDDNEPTPQPPRSRAPEAYEPPELHEAGNLRDLLGKSGGAPDTGSMIMNPTRA